MPEKITTIPYRDLSKNQEMKLLLAEPIERTSRVTANGLVIAENAGINFEESVVVSTCRESLFSPGDVITYKKLDRSKKDLFEAVHYEDKIYDIIGESEVWSVNDFPYGRIYIEPYAEPEKSVSGLIIPQKVEGVTQKGRIVSAPPNSLFKENDEVEYRRNNMGVYYNATVNGTECEVLYPPDVYLLNGKVSPYKIIVRIDISAQKIKKETTESGLLLSPLYQYMLYNLQYGEVMEIGSEAAEFYPEIEVGDTAILHHFVESDDFRVIKKEYGKYENVLYEYRVINCLDKKHREIFGKLHHKKSFPSHGANMFSTRVTPCGENIFLKWDFEFLNKDKGNSPLSLLELPGIEDCTNKIQLMDEIGHRRAAGVLYYKTKMGGYTADMNRHNPTTPQGMERMQEIATKINNLRRDQEKAAAYVNGDFLLICEQLFPKTINRRVICTYKQLYAINILGRKYLIADKDFIFLNIDDMNRLHATGEKVLIKPETEVKNSGMIIPDSAREIPQKGTVVSVGHLVTDPDIKEGFTILYRKGAAMTITYDGIEYFVMKQGDIICHVEDSHIANLPQEGSFPNTYPHLLASGDNKAE